MRRSSGADDPPPAAARDEAGSEIGSEAGALGPGLGPGTALAGGRDRFGLAGETGRRQRHETWMWRALEISAGTGPGTDRADRAGDVPVGAVVFGPDGTELATARNERELTGDPTAHAEILALRRAAAAVGAWRLDGCTLVVTLEPCTMCAGALVLARVATVVFGAWEPKTGAVGSLWDVVRDRRLNHRPEVYGGVLEKECGAVLRAFFRSAPEAAGG